MIQIDPVLIEEARYTLPVKMWAKEVETSAIEQITNLSKFPFAFHHIAIMPDVHFGFGMPIGGVMATEGVVIPNAVGVDIGCFSGDTKVPLLNGMQKTLRELTDEGSDVYVYSLNSELKLVAGKATPKLTKKNAEVMEVIISGGEVIRCTMDHRFMLLDGSYKEAQSLNAFDSLMPLYRSYESKDGYEHIKTSTGSSVATHRMVARQFLGERKDGDITHHKDEHWYNNGPLNLEYKNARLHIREHREHNPIFGTVKFKKKRLATLKENGFFDPKYKDKKKQVAITNISAHNGSPKKKECDALAGERGKEFLIAYNKSKKGRDKSSENGKKYGFGRNNHKVLFTRRVEAREDVYCLTVEGYHNFALSAGVFVHNCGMCALRTTLKDLPVTDLKLIMGEIRKAIPVGFSHQQKPQDGSLMPLGDGIQYTVVDREYDSALKQIGTLGGGNHFIEIQKGSDGFIWIMIHSGSRNLGKQVADHYNKIAMDLNWDWASQVPKEWQLAFLPIHTAEGIDYLREMKYCVQFALENRRLMMSRVMEAFVNRLGHDVGFDEIINIAHNYASMENHFSRNVLVHRKGATLAREGTIGIIPGSMGSKSYIVRGKGNPDSFMSCSHGAGRKMSRTRAQKELSLEGEIKMLDDQGIVHGIRNEKDLDEAAGAYKSIVEVMVNQSDLVDIVVELSPLGVIKG
jgi:tRNA-splicing ligase RtcB